MALLLSHKVGIMKPLLIILISSLLGHIWAKSPSFDPHCDIHTVNPGRRAPDSVFPAKANSSWLHVSKETINEWYVTGKQECEANLESARKDLASGHADYFTLHSNPAMRNCRGRNTLLDYSGTILWPFGPYKECPTYSKCWFGVLSCGEPKNKEIRESIAPALAAEMKKANMPGELPPFTKFSVRALNMMIRVVGAEIVVPELKYVTLASQEDVIIGQYVLTRVYAETKLEMRMFELYPSLLFEWSDAQRYDFGMHNWMSMHLGGSEGRCRPWTKCDISNVCCGCDEKSFVFNTPAAVAVTDGLGRCPQARSAALPLCGVRDSSQPGRWISSELPEFSPHCDTGSARNVIFHKDVRHVAKDKHPADAIKQHKHFNITEHHYVGDEWFEASGDPCLVNSRDPEEAGKSHWFYAPYTCKYHFYNSVELHKCLIDKNLTHIHVAGDSMSRDLFMYLSLYLGVPQIDEAELKRLSTELKEQNVAFHSGQVLLSEGYSWDWNLGVMKLAEMAPLPNIYITNYAFEHRVGPFLDFQAQWNATEYQYWTHDRPTSVHKPEFMFFQNARELVGRRNLAWSANEFRQESAFLSRNYTSLGFSVMDEFQFSTGRYDLHIASSDGWHFGGTKRQMEAVGLFNMVCNDWFKAVKTKA